MKKSIKIIGTHCNSCKVLLERELKTIRGIKKVEVDFKTGKTDIEYKSKLLRGEIEKIVNKYNYSLGIKKEKTTAEKWMETIIALMIVVNGWFLVKFLGLEKYLPNSQTNNQVLSGLLMGVVASLSTCLALVGNIVLSLGSNKDGKENWKKQIWFHVGRLTSFGVLGGMLGMIGGGLNYSTNVISLITMVVGIYTGYKGLEILGVLSPKVCPTLGTGKKIGGLLNKNRAWPIVLGGLTFFVPCGFTQTAQIMAIGSGRFGAGLQIMLAFAVGTLPVLLIIGLSSGFLKTDKYSLIKKIIGMIIVGLAIGTIISSTRLINFGTIGRESNSDKVTIDSEKMQVIKMEVSNVFTPSEFVIKKGISVRWEINGDRATGCTNEVVIPKLKITSGKLKKGINIVEFTADEVGVLPFSCWMGMVQGKFIVEE